MKKSRKLIVKDLSDIIRQNELSYQEFIELCKEAREVTELKPKKRPQKVKPVPSVNEIITFLNGIENINITDSIMFKILSYMAIRSCELVRIRIEDLDLTPGSEKIYLRRKAGLDKTMLIPTKLASVLRVYLGTIKDQVYLFESRFHKAYTERSIREKTQKYRTQFGLNDNIHPHNLRHLLLTLLATEGYTDSQLQLISGHIDRTSLDKYIYQNPEMIRDQYNKSINNMKF